METEQNLVPKKGPNWMWVTLLTVVILSLAIGTSYFLLSSKKAAETTSPTRIAPNVSTAATGNPDEITSKVIQDSINEQSTYSSEGGDKGLVSNDKQELGNYDQTYNENGF